MLRIQVPEKARRRRSKTPHTARCRSSAWVWSNGAHLTCDALAGSRAPGARRSPLPPAPRPEILRRGPVSRVGRGWVAGNCTVVPVLRAYFHGKKLNSYQSVLESFPKREVRFEYVKGNF